MAAQPTAERRPLIGISASGAKGSSRLNATYTQAIAKAGGAPVIIPELSDPEALRSILDGLDGLVISGGADVNPLWYGESPRQALGGVEPARDLYELRLIKLATDRRMPVLGICRGLQLLNVAFGGSLYQDIPSQYPDHIGHNQDMPGAYGSHKAYIQAGTKLAEILGEDSVAVNSFHHQSIKALAPIFKVAALAPDRVVEAIDAYPERPIFGVQWHPEGLVQGGDTTMLRIFRFQVERAKEYHEQTNAKR